MNYCLDKCLKNFLLLVVLLLWGPKMEVDGWFKSSAAANNSILSQFVIVILIVIYISQSMLVVVADLCKKILLIDNI